MEETKFVKVTHGECSTWYEHKEGEIFKVYSYEYGLYKVDGERKGIRDVDCKEITLKELLMRNHTECTTRDGDTYIVVGNKMYNSKCRYLELEDYKDDLIINDKFSMFDIMKITYKDEVLWERQEKKRTEMSFMNCIEELYNNSEKYYLECEIEECFELKTYKYFKTYGEDSTIGITEIVNGKWFLCER